MNLGYTFSAFFSMLLVILTGIRYHNSTVKELVDVGFLRLIGCVALYCAFDAIWGVFSVGLIISQKAFTISCYSVYLMAGIVTFTWLNYMVEFIGARPGIQYVFKAVSVSLLIIQVLILIGNEFTHGLFFINSEGVYHYSYGRMQLQLLQAINYTMIFVYGIANAVSDRIQNRTVRLEIVYSFIPGIFGIGQMLLFDVSMYSYGFALTVVAMYIFDKSSRILNSIDEQYKEEREERLSIINGLAGDFSSIYSIDMVTNGFVVYNKIEDEEFLEKIDNSEMDYFKVAVEKGRKMIHEDDLESFLMVMDKDVIRKRFETDHNFSLILRIRFGNSIRYMEYRFTYNNIGHKERIIIGVYDVDRRYRRKLREAQLLKTAKERQMALEEEAMLLDKAAHRDIMTGLYNRRAYEDHIHENNGMPDGKDFVYVSLDANGLKAVNDDLGHEAGDELIKGVAFCMKKILGEYGYVYRHGGDEFCAILHVPKAGLEKLFKRFDIEVEKYEGKLIQEIAVSYGYVTGEEVGVIPIEDIAKIADKKMYEAKAAYYAKKGIDRRGQQDAYDAIRKSYLKILKVDLEADSFANIYMDESESGSDKGYDTKLSKWLHDFATSGNVHPEDKEKFLNLLDYEKITNHFANSKDTIAVHYKRKSEDGYNNALLEIIPAIDFSDASQIVFLYVKNIY